MRRHGLIVIGMGDWYGNCYLLHMPEPYPTAGHPDEIDLKEALEFGKEMVERSQKITAGEIGLIPSPPPPALLPPPFKDNTVLTLSDLLKFHKEKCLYPQCRLCMENCPMYGIDLSVDPPLLAKPCLSCEFCARVCPTGALDIDEWVHNMASMTSASVSSMILGSLEKAEGEGRFRRLIPVNKINFNTFGYMLHKKHPQWIVGKGLQ